MKARQMNINLQEYLDSGKSLEDIEVEGDFHPKKDKQFLGVRGTSLEYSIKDNPNWGFTSTKQSFKQAVKKGVAHGYYHKHGEERAYLGPSVNLKDVWNIVDGLIPCLECEVGIMRNVWKYDGPLIDKYVEAAKYVYHKVHLDRLFKEDKLDSEECDSHYEGISGLSRRSGIAGKVDNFCFLNFTMKMNKGEDVSSFMDAAEYVLKSAQLAKLCTENKDESKEAEELWDEMDELWKSYQSNTELAQATDEFIEWLNEGIMEAGKC